MNNTRVKKNKKNYGNKTIVKSYKIYKSFIALMILSLIGNCFTIYHFLTFNHNKVKTVVKKEKYVPENIVFLGDSITEYYDLDKFFPNNKIVNSGVGGNLSHNILDDMYNRVYKYNPSKVFLLIGTNDIRYKKTNKQIVDNTIKIIEGIKENRPDTKIYLESIYPVNKSDDEKIQPDLVNIRSNEQISDINKELKKYAQNNDVTYINIYDKLLDEDNELKLDYTKEGLHLNDEGYKVVTKEIKKYI